MRKWVLGFFSVSLLALTGFAQTETEFSTTAEFNNNRPRGWTCEAHGHDLSGGPGGPIYQSVWGYGSTEAAAIRDALSRCYSLGLHECSAGYCRRR